MISYDNYKNRIEKLAKVKQKLHKFRFLIAGALVLIVGAAVGLMCAKGAYTSGMSLSAQTVAFNEYYEVTPAKAFLSSPSDQHIEYREKSGGGWTREKPVKSGEYLARTVTKKIAGYSYSSAVEFEILQRPAEFTITGSSVTYGEVPHYTIPQLISGHKVDESALLFDYAEWGATTTEVNAVESTFKIVDENGDDFTNCYDVKFNGKTLNVNRRMLTVIPEGDTYTYDGTAHFARDVVTDETLQGLVNGDELTALTQIYDGSSPVDGAVNAGSYFVRFKEVKIMHGEHDVSAYYRLTERPARLIIEQRKLLLTTGSGEKVYDGDPLVNREISCENQVTGHTVSLDIGSLPYPVDAGEYVNKLTVTVRDADGEPVTANYTIDEENSVYGTLKISKRPLTVTTANGSKTYDGFALRNDEFTDFTHTETPDKFTFAAARGSRERVVDAGAYDNDFGVTAHLNGVDVTDNFDIKYVYGKITVNKRGLVVTTVGNQKVYDGTPLTYSDFSGDNVALYQRLQVTKPFSVTNVTAADGVEIDAEFTVVDSAGRDVGKNYEISYRNGKLIIEPLQISIKTVDDSREYDGTALTNAGYIATRINAYGTGLIGEDKLEVTKITGIIEAGSVPNECAYRLPTYDGARTNYEIVGEIEYGTLTIERKKVTVTIDNLTAVYGEEIPQISFVLDCGELPNNEILSFTTRYERGGIVAVPEEWEGYTLLNAGKYAIISNGDEQITGGNAHISNYEISYSDNLASGILEITKREIYYATADAEKIYDGTYLENTDYETYFAADASKAGLLRGDKLTVRNSPTSIITVEMRRNINYYDCPANYSINMETSAENYGWLEITPRPVIVYTADDTKNYDGTPLFNEDYTVKYAVEQGGKWVADDGKDGLVIREDTGALDTLTLIGKPVSITDAGSVKNRNRYENTNYYIRNYVDGTLTVEKMTIDLQSPIDGKRSHYGYFGSASFNYILTTPEGEFFRLPDGNMLTVKFRFVGVEGAPEVGKHTVRAYGYVIGDEEEGDGNSLKNYVITCTDGEMEIYAAPISVKVDDQTATYGDKILPDNTFGITDGKLYFGETLEFEYAYDPEVKDVGDYEITVTGVKVYDKEGNLKANGYKNYDFTFENGTLTVTQRALTVYLNYYDKNEEIYYGTPWAYAAGVGNYALAEGLVDGEQLEITAALGIKIIGVEGLPVDPGYNPETGMYQPDARTYFTDMTGGKIYVGGVEKENGLDNYSVTSVPGGLTVLKKEIEVTFDDDSIVYGETTDGKTYNFTVNEQLPYGEILSIESYVYVQDGEQVTPKNAGEYAIEGDEVLIDGSANGARNYEIAYKGTLTVEKKEINIKLSDRKDVYGDGNYNTDVWLWFAEFDCLEYGELLNARLKYGQNGEEITPRNVGEYDVSAAEFLIEHGGGIEYGLKEFTNYIINCGDGTLEITARPLKITVNDYEITYGDTVTKPSPIFAEVEGGIEGSVNTYGLPYHDIIAASFSYDGMSASQVKDVGKYEITVETWEVIAGNKNEDNYTIEWISGTLTVKPRTVYVVFGKTEKRDYGEAIPEISSKICELVDGKYVKYALPNGDTIEATGVFYEYDDADKQIITPKNARKYGVTAGEVRVNGELTPVGASSYEDGNYIIEVLDGLFEIEPKNVKVVLNGLDPVYYGDQFVYPAGVDNYANFDTITLAYNERLEVAVEYLIDGEVGTPKNANEYAWNPSYSARLKADACKIYESDGVTETENGIINYTFVCEDIENLKIFQRLITIYLLDYKEVYGDFKGYSDEIGNYKRSKYGNPNVEGAPYNEKFKIPVQFKDYDGNIIDGIPKNVGNYYIDRRDINNSKWEVYDEDGNVIPRGTENYVYLVHSGKLEIVPREVNIVLNSYETVYGNTFTYPDGADNYDVGNSTELAYEDKIEVAVKYQRAENGELVDTIPKNVDDYVIAGVSYTVYDGENIADSGNYSVKYVGGTLKITPKKIYAKILDDSTTYGEELPEVQFTALDGEELVCTLPYGDKLQRPEFAYAVFDADTAIRVTPRNAGEYFVFANEPWIVKNGETDVTGNYEIAEMGGWLEIEKADLNLRLKILQETVYGDYRSYSDSFGNYDSKNTVGIKLNDYIKVAVKYEVAEDIYGTGLVTVGDILSETPKNAAKYSVMLDEENSVIRTDEGDINLSQNYNVTCESYSFTISRREVNVSFIIPDYIYGETVQKPESDIQIELYEDIIDTDKLPYGETCDFDFVDENGNALEAVKDAGTYTIGLGKKYVNGEEKLAGNYVFLVSSDCNNTLTVNKKVVDIKLTDEQKVYGYKYDNYYAKQGDGYERVDGLTENVAAYNEELHVLVGYKVFGDEEGEFVIPKSVGKYTAMPVKYVIDGYVGDLGEDDWLNNYDITCANGNIQITEAKVTITVNDKDVEYGADLTKIDFGFTTDLAEMPYGEQFELSYTCDLGTPNAGEYEDAITATVSGVNGEGASLDNYDILDIVSGTLNVIPREILVTVYGGTGYYGDKDLPEISYEITEGELVGDEELVLAYKFGLNGKWYEKPQNVGTYSILVNGDKCAVTGGNERFDNYDVACEYQGKLVINKSPLTVEIIGDSFTYGERKLNVTYKITAGELFYDEELELTYFYDGEKDQPTAAGVYSITATAEITGGNGSIDNYELSFAETEPKLEILQREIQIAFDADLNSFAYGDDYDDAICTAADVDGALDNHTVNIAVTYAPKTAAASARMLRARTVQGFTPKAVGDYIATLDFDNCTVIDENGNPVEGGIGNYKLKASAAPLEFAITRMTLTVNIDNAEIVYGGKIPSALGYDVEEEMPYGESLSLSFSFADENDKLPVNRGNYPVTITSATAGGVDANDNYKIIYKNEEPRLVINEKPVTIYALDLKLPFNTKIDYAEAANNYDLNKSDKLVSGDVLTVTEVVYRDGKGNEYANPVDKLNAGKYEIVLKGYKIENADGGDVTANYDVTPENGELDISGNYVVIKTGSDTKEYDGTPLDADDGYTVIAGELAEGYEIRLTQSFSCTDVTPAGGVDNAAKYAVYDIYTNQISGNYIVTYSMVSGKIAITPRKIAVTAKADGKEYDGTPLKGDYKFEYSGENGYENAIAETDRLVINESSRASITDYGYLPYELTSDVYDIVNGYGVSVKRNYRITENNPATLQVSKKYITVTINSASAIYGEQPEITFTTDAALAAGESLRNITVEFRKGGVAAEMPLPVYTAYTIAGIVGGETVEGGRAKAENYYFEYALGAKLTVNQRLIAITTATDEREYDGEEFYNITDYKTYLVKDGKKQTTAGLLEGDGLEITAYTKLVEVDSVPNVYEYTVSGNYVVVDSLCENGTLKVTAIKIKVTTADIDEEYKGTPYSDGTLTYDESKLVSGHEIVVVGALTEQTDYTEGVPNALTVKVTDKDGNDFTDNYDIDCKYGTIKIRRRVLQVTTGDVSGVYSGEPQSNPNPAKVGESLLTDLNHRLETLNEYAWTNATDGEKNKTTYKVLDENDDDLSNNYDIKYTYGTIVITPAKVTVALNAGVEVEYGDQTYGAKLTYGAVTLLNGETAEIAIKTDRAVGGKGTYTAEADWSKTKVRSADGKEILNGADNYEPEFVPESVEFKVIARTVTVTLNAGGKTDFTYGEDYDSAICTVTTSWSKAGEIVKVKVAYNVPEPKNVGEYTAQLDTDNCKVEGGDIANYNLVASGEVTFNITRKDLTVYMNNLTVNFGEPLEYPAGDKGYYSAVGLLSGESLTVTPAFQKDGVAVEPEFAGEYDIVCGGISITDENGAVDADNYNLITGKPYGKLKIEGVNVLIERLTVEKEYDGDPIEVTVNDIKYYVNGVEGAPLDDGCNIVLDGEFATADGNVSSSCVNAAEYKIVDRNGEPARNYVITYSTEVANLTIKPRTVHVTTGSDTRKYNGTALTADLDYDTNELVAGHTLKVVSRASLTNVDSISNTVVLQVMSGSANVTANYDIQVEEGTLTVEALPVTVDIADIEKVYGEDINVNNFVLSFNLVNNERLNFRVLYTLGGERFDGSTYLDVGEYGIIADAANMAVNGGNRRADNYDLTFVETAKLKITERHIAVTTATASGEYSGEELYNITDYKTFWVKNGVKQTTAGLVGTDKLDITEYTKRVEVGSEPNVYEYTVSANYIIEESKCENGTLTVTKRIVTVTTNDINGTYNGQYHFNGGFTDDGKLLGGHEAVVDGEIFKQLDAVEKGENKFAVKIVSGDDDVTGYYEIKYVYGEVNIEKCDLNVTLNKNGKVSFDYGEPFEEDFARTEVSGLVDGEILTVALRYDTEDGKAPVNAGNYKVSFDKEKSTVSYVGGSNGLSNYNVICADVQFTIERSSVTLSLDNQADEEYNGKAHAYDTTGCKLVTDLFGEEELLTVAVKYSLDEDGEQIVSAPVNAGTYYVWVDTDNTTVSGGTAISANYVVDCEPVEFKITPKELIVTLTAETAVYNGGEHAFGESGFATNLCEGDEIECNVTYSSTPVDAGEYTVTFDYGNVVFKKGLAGNYEFDQTKTLESKLYITKRAITVTVEDRDVEKGSQQYLKAHLTSKTADGEEGFVGNDLADAEVEFIYFDEDGNELDGVPALTGTYTVSATFDEGTLSNYSIAVERGTLIVTGRKVKVTTVYNGGTRVYDGNAVDLSDFDFTDEHNVENCAADDKYGFDPEHSDNFTVTYVFTDENGEEVVGAPVKAGVYTVKADVSGENADSYCITYETCTFEIEKRTLTYAVTLNGDGEYEYIDDRPDIESDGVDLSATGFANGTPADLQYVFYKDGAVATSYDAGVYQVGVYFADIGNYDVAATTKQIKIVPRVLVVGTLDPFGGQPQQYNGESLKLGETDFIIHSGSLVGGHTLTIVSTVLEPTSKSGDLKIADYTVKNASGQPVKEGNYTVYHVYNANNALINSLGLVPNDFRVRATYGQRVIHYTLGSVGASYPYTGAPRTHEFDQTAISLSEGVTLGFGHQIKFARNYVSVSAAAGEYPSLIISTVRIEDAAGNNVSAIYSLVCDNPEAGMITVTENVLSLDLSGVSVDGLESGVMDCPVSGLYQSETVTHKAEVYAYEIDGEWIIGVTVFSENAAGKRTDLSTNYKLSASSALEGATVKIITLEQAEEYLRPALGVEISVNAGELASGKDTLYTFDGANWVLSESCYEVTGLQEGHGVQVVVFSENGNYTLGVTVYSDVGGRKVDARSAYRLKDIVSGVTASYVAVADVSNTPRALYINFDGAFDGEGKPVTENGLLTGYTVEGLNQDEDHKIEITVTENGDGYTLSVVVYQLRKLGSTYRKFNRTTIYDFNYTAPEGVTVVKGTIS